tara:strand:+ start:120 stop:377 length:258 start_codon:yes stop_codon:yes gene_type:complete
MPKFYVETGTLQDVVTANEPFDACVLAIRRATDEYLKGGDNVTLGESFIVNQKGFPSNRKPFTLDTANDTMVSTSRIIEALEDGS